MAAEIERNRLDLHVPGAALAIVRGDEVIFARGFGLADVEKLAQLVHDPTVPLTALAVKRPPEYQAGDHDSISTSLSSDENAMAALLGQLRVHSIGH